MTSRWGSRYRRSGKTLWTEQDLDAVSGAGGDAVLAAFGVDLDI